MDNLIRHDGGQARVWDSAFKFVEAPMCYLNKKQRVLASSFVVPGNENKDSKTHVFYKDQPTLGIKLAMGIVYPLTLALTPFSIIADMFLGVSQALFRLYQGADQKEIKSILHKKVFASPAQQMTFLAVNGVALFALCYQLKGPAYFAACIFTIGAPKYQLISLFNRNALVFAISAVCVSPILGCSLYTLSQKCVSGLPRCCRPDGYNIFIDGGAQNQFGEKIDFNNPESFYETWRREHDGESKTSEENQSAFNSLKISISKELKDLPKTEKFDKFRTWLNSTPAQPPFALFGFTSESQVTEKALKEKFKNLAKEYHPDKCPDAKEEAGVYFKLIFAARLNIEKTILKIHKQPVNED